MSKRGNDRTRSHSRTAFLALGLLLVILAGRSVQADASSLIPGAPGIEVFSAEEVLRDHIDTDARGGLLFVEADGARVPFVTDVYDPMISNHGDGAFHPASVDEVVSALAAIEPGMLGGIRVSVYVLPFPRASLLSSSAGDGAIYLSPGVREYEPAQIHFLVAHELGHVVHRRYLPDDDLEGWRAYRELRGLTDEETYAPEAAHAYRPHEVFAEDFRVLFGGSLARGNGSIENHELRRPENVPRLRDFFRRTVGQAPLVASTNLRLGPNPWRPGSALLLRGLDRWVQGQPTTHASLFAANGQRVREFEIGAGEHGEVELNLAAGERNLPSGAYWLVVAAGSQRETLPLRIIR